MFIFGGIDQTQERFNDINEFNFDSQTWTRVLAAGQTPSTRTFHESIMFKGVMYIFGGFDGMKRNDIYRILFDEESRKKNLQDFEVRSFTRSYSIVNQSIEDNDAMSDGQLFQSHHFNSQGGLDSSIVGENLVNNSLVPISMSSSTKALQKGSAPCFTNEYFAHLPVGQWRKL